MPPSVNSAYANGNSGRYKTKAYKEWEKSCEATQHKLYKFTPDGKIITAKYRFYSKWKNKNGTIKVKDLSNYFKCLDDYIPNIIKGFDDRYIWKIEAEKIHSDREVVEVEIIEN